MRQTTFQRHETIRDRIDKRVEELKGQGVQGFVRIACRELSNEIGYTERTLIDIYYDYDDNT